MIFIETPIFTKRLRELLSDDSYTEFQPSWPTGRTWVIEGTGGIRKVALLLIYPKNANDDLTADERKMLKQIIDRWR